MKFLKVRLTKLLLLFVLRYILDNNDNRFYQELQKHLHSFHFSTFSAPLLLTSLSSFALTIFEKVSMRAFLLLERFCPSIRHSVLLFSTELSDAYKSHSVLKAELAIRRRFGPRVVLSFLLSLYTMCFSLLLLSLASVRFVAFSFLFLWLCSLFLLFFS